MSWFRKAIDRRRRGVAIVEFAVVLPLLLTVLFGIIEYGWVFLIRQTLQTAAREGCRVAVLASSTSPYTDVITRVADVMTPTGVSTYQLQMTHATAGDPTESVVLSVPFADVSLLGAFFNHGSGDLVGSCTMRKEGM